MLQFQIAKKYFKNIIVNLIFSAVMMSGFYLRLQIISAEKFSATEAYALLLCEILTALLSATYTAYIMRTFPRQMIKTVSAALIWSIIFFAESVLVKVFCASCGLSDSLVFVICAFIYAILFGLMILSFCGCIYARDSASSLLTLKNAVFFLKMFSGGILAIVAVCIAAFSTVNTRGGRTWLIIVPKDVTDTWEQRIFAVILFLFIPLYALIFIQLYEAMLEGDS